MDLKPLARVAPMSTPIGDIEVPLPSKSYMVDKIGQEFQLRLRVFMR
jgi:hypothetical protein